MSASSQAAAMRHFSSLAAPPRLRMQRQQRIAQLEARYDAAQTTDLNKKYWRNADRLSPDVANNPQVRAILRSRARYECHESDSVLKGVVHTLANDVIGKGPRLQLRLANPELNRAIETQFHRWCKLVQLARKLRTMRIAKCVDGEAFAQFATNRKLRFPVQLDIKPFEADRCASPFLNLAQPDICDGIRFDQDGNPETYFQLKYHPGGNFGFDLQPLELPADQVIHLYRQDRPEQHRGIPEITPALPLCALRRDYVLAVLHNARSNAKFTGILETGAPDVSSEEGFDSSVEPFDMVDIDYDMLTSLPYGWKLKQFTAAHPVATFEMFVRVITNEIGRCILMPYGITAADSSRYNYSSGRLDHQSYFFAIEVERSDWEVACLDRILEQWLDEALLIPGFLPPGLGPMDELPHQWFWDRRGSIDPLKEAAGTAQELQSGCTHRARAYAEQGLDVDVEDALAAQSYGVAVEEYRRALFARTFSGPGSTINLTDVDETSPTRQEEEDLANA